MTEWLTAEETLDKARIPITEDRVRILRVLGHKKKIRWTKTLGCIQYDWDSFNAYREQQARGKSCEANQDSISSLTIMEESNLPTGTLPITTEAEVAAALRGIELARKTMKPKSHSRNSSLNVKGQNPRSQVSL